MAKMSSVSQKFLGHIVIQNGIATERSKPKSIQDWRFPTNSTEMRSLLVLATYSRRFISGFTAIADPLHCLLNKGSNTIRQKIIKVLFESYIDNYLALQFWHPNSREPFIIDVDARGTEIGEVLPKFRIGYCRRSFINLKLKGVVVSLEESYLCWWLCTNNL